MWTHLHWIPVWFLWPSPNGINLQITGSSYTEADRVLGLDFKGFALNLLIAGIHVISQLNLPCKAVVRIKKGGVDPTVHTYSTSFWNQSQTQWIVITGNSECPKEAWLNAARKPVQYQQHSCYSGNNQFKIGKILSPFQFCRTFLVLWNAICSYLPLCVPTPFSPLTDPR